MNILLIIYAANNILLGLGGLFMPSKAVPVEKPPAIALSLMQSMASFAIATGVLAWLARGITDVTALRAITLAFILATTINGVVLVIAIRKGVRKASEWIFVGIDAIFAATFLYFRAQL